MQPIRHTITIAVGVLLVCVMCSLSGCIFAEVGDLDEANPQASAFVGKRTGVGIEVHLFNRAAIGGMLFGRALEPWEIPPQEEEEIVIPPITYPDK